MYKSLDGGPEVPGIVGTELLPGDAVGRARVARNDSVQEAAPRLRIDCPQVRPERRVVGCTVFNARDQLLGDREFVFHVQDAASVWQSEPDAEVETESSGAERGVIPGTWSHTYAAFARFASVQNRQPLHSWPMIDLPAADKLV